MAEETVHQDYVAAEVESAGLVLEEPGDVGERSGGQEGDLAGALIERAGEEVNGRVGFGLPVHRPTLEHLGLGHGDAVGPAVELEARPGMDRRLRPAEKFEQHFDQPGALCDLAAGHGHADQVAGRLAAEVRQAERVVDVGADVRVPDHRHGAGRVGATGEQRGQGRDAPQPFTPPHYFQASSSAFISLAFSGYFRVQS